MSTTASLAAAPRHRISPSDAPVRLPPTPRPSTLATDAAHQQRAPTRAEGHPAKPRSDQHVSGPVPSTMSDPDITRLARTLDLATHMHPKLNNSPVSLGLARLDFASGLFLARGSSEGRWILEGRTWGHPSPQAAHDWHLRSAAAAHQLDPTVTLPARLAAVASGAPRRPPSRAASKHSAGLGRRLLMKLR
jgi:hypothetical protein